MVGRLFLRGLLAGAIAGLIAFGFARIFGEPALNLAIAFEEATTGGHSHDGAGEADGHTHDGEPVVSRATQAGIGLLTVTVLFGVGLGGLLSLVFGFVYGRISTLGPRGTAALLAVAAFVSVNLVPAIKYPPAPPGVGDPDTVGFRTVVYLVMVLVSIGAAASSVSLSRSFAARVGTWNSAILGIVLFVIIVTIAHVSLPDVSDVPANFPPTVLWDFRVASLGLQLVLWVGIGLVFGALAKRALASSQVAR